LRMTVVVMSFNPDAETARRWNREVGSPFTHLIDPEVPGTPGDAGAVYHGWGLRKSLKGVWSPESIRFYSDQRLGGAELHPPLGQDVHRMGGDIMLDGEGRLILDHYSKTNTDRPNVEGTILPLGRAMAVQQTLASARPPRYSKRFTAKVVALTMLVNPIPAVSMWNMIMSSRRYRNGFLAVFVACAMFLMGRRNKSGSVSKTGRWATTQVLANADVQEECKT